MKCISTREITSALRGQMKFLHNGVKKDFTEEVIFDLDLEEYEQKFIPGRQRWSREKAF